MNDKCIVLNAKKMNFDGNLDFSVLSSDVTVYDDTTPEQLLERIEGAGIIVTKEMPVSGDLIRKFPASVKLICEAGTGYNNLDLDAAREMGITVCNIPAYSSERVAHTAIMMILNLSSTMQVQMKMLANGNHDNFTKNLQVPHVEVNGKTPRHHRCRTYRKDCDENRQGTGYEHSRVYKNTESRRERRPLYGSRDRFKK